MEVGVNYDPHHVISDRRQENKNKPFEHSEVEGLFEATNWMDYPKDINNGEDMKEKYYLNNMFKNILKIFILRQNYAIICLRIY